MTKKMLILTTTNT